MATALEQRVSILLSDVRNAIDSFLRTEDVLDMCVRHVAEEELSELISLVVTATRNPPKLGSLMTALTGLFRNLLLSASDSISTKDDSSEHFANPRDILTRRLLEADENVGATIVTFPSIEDVLVEDQQKQDAGYVTREERSPNPQLVSLSRGQSSDTLMFISSPVASLHHRQLLPYIPSQYVTQQNTRTDVEMIAAPRVLQINGQFGTPGKSFKEVFNDLPCIEMKADEVDEYKIPIAFVRENPNFVNDIEIGDVDYADLDTKSPRNFITPELLKGLVWEWSVSHDCRMCLTCPRSVSWGWRLRCLGVVEVTVYVYGLDGSERPLRLQFQVVPHSDLPLTRPLIGALVIKHSSLLNLV